MTLQKNRIEFIDLAKGVCILLVVILHCGGPTRLLPGFELVRMPLYFVLSGLFFKDYGKLTNLAIKKTNKLLIPFLFFHIVPYFLFLSVYKLGEILSHEPNHLPYSILDIFTRHDLFNVPIWFLPSLFWCNIIFYLIHTQVQKVSAQYILIAICAFIGYLIGHYTTLNFLYIDISLSALPFFCLGYYVKHTKLLYRNKYDRYNPLFALILWVCSLTSYKIFSPSLDFFMRDFSGISVYFIASLSVFSMLFLCKSIGRLPLISYIGRYSIVILCTHQLVYNAIAIATRKYLHGMSLDWWIVFAIVLTASICCIPLCLKLIPKFVAQKDLIPIK